MRKYLCLILLFFSILSFHAQSYRIIDGTPRNSKMVQSLLGCKGNLNYNKNNNTYNLDLYDSDGYKEISYVLSSNGAGKQEYIYRFGTEPFSKEAPGYVMIKDFKIDEYGIERFTLTIYVFGNSDLYEFRFARRN